MNRTAKGWPPDRASLPVSQVACEVAPPDAGAQQGAAERQLIEADEYGVGEFQLEEDTVLLSREGFSCSGIVAAAGAQQRVS